MQTPYELTLELIEKSGVDVHHASVGKFSATIEMTCFETAENIKKVVTAFMNRWGHVFDEDGHTNNKGLGCTMIYFKAK